MRVLSEDRQRKDRLPNPKSSILKIKGSEIQQATTELLLEIAGPLALPYQSEADDPEFGSNEPPGGPRLGGAGGACLLQLPQDHDLRRLQRDPAQHPRQGRAGLLMRRGRRMLPSPLRGEGWGEVPRTQLRRLHLTPTLPVGDREAGSTSADWVSVMSIETWLALPRRRPCCWSFQARPSCSSSPTRSDQGMRTAMPVAVGVALGDFTAMTLSMLGWARCWRRPRCCSRL